MNLWVKAPKLAIVTMLALFFIACKEELNNVGSNEIGDQFDLLYQEFTLPSHVIIDSVSTGSFGLIAGSYSDPEFGVVTAGAFAQYGAPTSFDLTDSDIIFDSLVLNLKLTDYYYGADDKSSSTFTVHELTEEIVDINDKTNFSNVMYDPLPIGQGDYILDAEIHDQLTSDTTLSIRVDDRYFQRMKDVLTYSETISDKDTINTTTEVSPETGFYGLAMLASNSDKIIGIGTNSQLTVHYHTSSLDSLEYNYLFTTNRFNNITSDRTGTALSELTDDNPRTPITPENNMRYVQSGTGITTELDFQQFFEFFAQKDHMVINSVELSLGEIASTSDLAAPTGISLFNTDENSKLSSLVADDVSFSSVQSDATTQLFMPFTANDDTGVYSALPTKYFQLLYDAQVERSTARISPTLVSNSTLVTETGSTVDRFVVHQDSIKLKVYYTLPK